MWTIEYAGVEKTLEEWEVKNLSFGFLSFDIDAVAFEIPTGLDSDPVFADGSTLKFYRTVGGEKVQWFAGRVDQTPQSASGRYESDGYVVVGPWWHLVNLVFQKSWTEYVNPLDLDEGTTTKFRSHIILNLAIDGSYQNTTEQITEVLEWCLACADAKGVDAPFQIGTIDLPLAQPYTAELVDRSCAEVIQNQIRWTPDAVGYFDYSTNPPTIHIKQRAAQRVVQVAADELEQIALRPRRDLQVPSVVIKYESVDVVNGIAYPRLTLDIAPPGADGREFKSLVSTVNLEGAAVSYSVSQIVCTPIDAGSPAWWQAAHTPFADASIQDLAITSVARQTAFPREIVGGVIAEWMLREQSAQRETITALATYDIVDDAGKIIESRKDQPVSVEIVTTDLTTGTYKNSFDLVLAEPVPVGLANYLYAAASVLHYDGRIGLAEGDCTFAAGLGDLINVTGARADYASMNAQVQAVNGSIADGKTVLTVGPAKHLGKDDIIEFLQANRGRVRYTSAAAMTGGFSTSAPVSLGKETPIKNSNASGGKIEKQTIAESYIIEPRVDNPDSREVRLRETPVCIDGEQWYALFARSDYYRK